MIKFIVYIGIGVFLAGAAFYYGVVSKNDIERVGSKVERSAKAAKAAWENGK